MRDWPTCLLRPAAALGLALVIAAPGRAPAIYDWEAGPWGVVVSSNGSPGSAMCPVTLPNGTRTGNAVAVHYQFTPVHLPQLWVLLTDGVWRQAAADSRFGTSYRWFGYYSADNTNRDRPVATRIAVTGTNAAGELVVQADYANDAPNGDRFRIAASAVLETPDSLRTSLRANVTVSNASGHAVGIAWQGHRALAEQWRLLHVVSMHVARDWSGGVPAWYTALDPPHAYVGALGDADRMNDAWSVNGAIYVPAHDVRFVAFDGVATELDHDTALCPPIAVPEYSWYDQLVVYDRAASRAALLHALRSHLNHRVELTAASGLVTNPAALRWCVAYNRNDPSSVDGDNVQVRLGADAAIEAWPDAAIQSFAVRMVAGNEQPAVTSVTATAAGSASLAWTAEPGELYGVQFGQDLSGSWSNVVAASTNNAAGPLPARPGFYRIVETPAQ